jgi:uncharacterized LabA/DUF88 family protein
MSPPRAMVFIDAQNLSFGSKNYGDGIDNDPTKLVAELTEECELLRSYWFDAYPPGDRQSKDSFFYFLETNGFRVDAVPLRESDRGYEQKGLDINLATELIARGFDDAYDVAIVVSGDDDFNRAIRYVQDQGKVVNVAAFESTMSADLKRRADEYIKLDDIADEIQRDPV